MNDPEVELPRYVGIEVETACGGKVTLAEDTPRADHNGCALYFCLEECKTLYENDPSNSCLEDRFQAHSI